MRLLSDPRLVAASPVVMARAWAHRGSAATTDELISTSDFGVWPINLNY